MKDSYMVLGVTPSGNALVQRPILPGSRDGFAFHTALCDLVALGYDETARLFGHMLICGLGPYQPEVKGYPLLPPPPKVVPFPTDPQLIDPRGEMRRLRTGPGVARHATGPALIVRTYDGKEPIADDFQQSLTELAELGKDLVPSLIGEIVLRKLAALHPDVLPPLFPTIFSAAALPG